MGLYLCVFRGEEELAAVEVGRYEDFEALRAEARRLDRRVLRRFGTLRTNVTPTTHWSPRAAARLDRELEALGAALAALPARPWPAGSWQAEVASRRGLVPASLRDCFIDVEGEPLLERLRGLCRLAVAEGQPILFQ